ncbi:50S ribosomal protein L9 [Campylobacter insulaenigrae]|uniref:Large ribosomal subunit protein bL9 n=1 Tax=Campylobacter insulaenigrae TaxID=260714 RepID=A0ABY3G308_9BACT|nr:50S ribosomal protein L9 [Campylobacter insulaenigrae]MCR6570104.1 50S ribosomal protein L9 [Campylobacter insulaenigrae]MCR6571889.1 50S ribosomal protein L9 [Campylobacter insulaenigrae]MCR6573147.1 50S ribosomal protein L9 [Campylobacter insulaenigrae]MCR6574934.1 50S ribosomal protein L9 [Campylobacter insulaenigrae]MCR6576384.1 50S ribosomal protein L9 [Campylobacter insulaenigrae]
MKVLLIKDVKSLGKTGEIKEVKDGYGQNFLIAKGFAKAATHEVLKQYEAQEKKKAENLRFELANLEKMKEELAKITIIINKAVGANGGLFGGVTKDEIAHALKEQKNIEIDKKSLECETIKELGIHEISIKLGHSIHAKFKLEVRGE